MISLQIDRTHCFFFFCIFSTNMVLWDIVIFSLLGSAVLELVLLAMASNFYITCEWSLIRFLFHSENVNQPRMLKFIHKELTYVEVRKYHHID